MEQEDEDFASHVKKFFKNKYTGGYKGMWSIRFLLKGKHTNSVSKEELNSVLGNIG